MKLTKKLLARMIREEISHMTGLRESRFAWPEPASTPTMSVEVEWYPPQWDEESEGRNYVVPIDVAKQGEDAIRNFIDGKYYPRYKYIITQASWDEIDQVMGA